MKKLYRSFIIILSVLLFVMPFGTVKAETGPVDEKLFSECAEEYAYEFLNCSFGTTENKLSQTTDKYSVLPCYYDYARALSAYFRSRMELYAYEDVSISIRPTDKAIENNIYYFNYLVDIGFQLLLNDNRSGIGRKMTVAVREFDGKPQIIGLVLITEPFLDLDVSGHVTDEEVRSSLRTFIDEPSRSADYIAELEKTTSKNNSTPRYTKEDIKNSTVTKEDNRKMEEEHSKTLYTSYSSTPELIGKYTEKVILLIKKLKSCYTS